MQDGGRHKTGAKDSNNTYSTKMNSVINNMEMHLFKTLVVPFSVSSRLLVENSF